MHLQKHAGAYITELTKNSRERERKKSPCCRGLLRLICNYDVDNFESLSDSEHNPTNDFLEPLDTYYLQSIMHYCFDKIIRIIFQH